MKGGGVVFCGNRAGGSQLSPEAVVPRWKACIKRNAVHLLLGCFCIIQNNGCLVPIRRLLQARKRKQRL